MKHIHALEDAGDFLSDAAFNVRGHWGDGPEIVRNTIIGHIEAAEALLEIEIRRIG